MANENHSYTKKWKSGESFIWRSSSVDGAWKEVSPGIIKLSSSQVEIISKISSEEKCDILTDENNDNVELHEEFLQLFNSDSECSEFEGFEWA